MAAADVNGSGQIEAIDVLQIINYLSAQARSTIPEGESRASASTSLAPSLEEEESERLRTLDRIFESDLREILPRLKIRYDVTHRR